MDEDSSSPLIGIVGPCGSGKSTLMQGLNSRGSRCRHIAQEHSYVKTMRLVITNPDFLIYLECSFELRTSRRRLNWLRSDYDDQLVRLSHAHDHADLILQTDQLAPDEVVTRVVEFVQAAQSSLRGKDRGRT